MMNSLQKINRPFSILLKSGRVSSLFRTRPTDGARLASTSEATIQRTALYDFHVKHKGRMVPFAGWELPVQYTDALTVSHNHTRNKCSIFDVSHMLQFHIHGKDRVKFLEQLVVADVEGFDINSGGLSLFMNDKGGIRDDCIINKLQDYIYVVSNAGCADKIRPLLEAHEADKKGSMDIAVEFLDTQALLALQGPSAANVLQNGISSDLNQMKFMNGITADLFGIPNCRVTRCGYTGEDGFEISVPSNKIEHLADSLLGVDANTVKLAGLGPRDTLRLEAGLCLYGNDIDEDTTPAEATLVWTLGKRRRQARDFPGAEIVLKQIKEKPQKKRVGIITTSGPPPRAGAKVLSEDGAEIGHVTSGCPSPCLKKNIAMAYVKLRHAKAGANIKVQVRKKEYDGQVAKMPFVPTNYCT